VAPDQYANEAWHRDRERQRLKPPAQCPLRQQTPPVRVAIVLYFIQ
jgi:hypothetical protein